MLYSRVVRTEWLMCVYSVLVATNTSQKATNTSHDHEKKWMYDRSEIIPCPHVGCKQYFSFNFTCKAS